MARVASVLPSATEILCFIGGEALLVGRSHEDNYPPSVSTLPVLTGQTTTYTTAADVDRTVSESIGKGESLYTLDIEIIKRLRPDVVLTQDICSVCAIDLQTVERVAASMDPAPLVVSLNPLNLDDVLSNILQVGAAVGMQAEAEAAHARLLARIEAVDQRVARRRAAEGRTHEPPRVAFIEWPEPLYVGGHWTPQLIERAGGAHPLNTGGADGGGKSFPVSSEAVVAIDPDVVILAPCGLNLHMTRREADNLLACEWFASLRAVRDGRLVIVDGDAMFNRPGPRLIDALEWLNAAIHDERSLAPANFPAEWIATPPPQQQHIPATSDHRAPAYPPQELSEIEEAHACAVREGKLQYVDPKTGYQVFTQLASSNRGYCCGSGCRHCVYGHMNVKDPERKRKLKPPITIEVEG